MGNLVKEDLETLTVQGNQMTIPALILVQQSAVRKIALMVNVNRRMTIAYHQRFIQIHPHRPEMKHAEKSQIAAQITVQRLALMLGKAVEVFVGTKTLQNVTTLGLVLQGLLKRNAARKSVVLIDSVNQLKMVVVD